MFKSLFCSSPCYSGMVPWFPQQLNRKSQIVCVGWLLWLRNSCGNTIGIGTQESFTYAYNRADVITPASLKQKCRKIILGVHSMSSLQDAENIQLQIILVLWYSSTLIIGGQIIIGWKKMLYVLLLHWAQHAYMPHTQSYVLWCEFPTIIIIVHHEYIIICMVCYKVWSVKLLHMVPFSVCFIVLTNIHVLIIT